MNVVEVAHPQDERLLDYRGLSDLAWRDRHESAAGVFITEGVVAIRRLLVSAYVVRSLLVTRKALAALQPDLDGLSAPVYVVPNDVLRDTVGFDLHRGALAAVVRPPAIEAAALLDGPGAVAVLEGVNDHENLGVVFRNARAFGIAAVLLDDECPDPLYRRSVRVSMGHLLHVPFARIGALPEGLAAVRAAGRPVVALTPAPDAQPVETLAGLDRPALLLGAEGPGLRPETLAAADLRVRIPIAADVDSLNVATAAAIAFHRLSG